MPKEKGREKKMRIGMLTEHYRIKKKKKKKKKWKQGKKQDHQHQN